MLLKLICERGTCICWLLIDGWLQIKQDEKVQSPDDHWNEKIRADYRAKDDLKIKEKN